MFARIRPAAAVAARAVFPVTRAVPAVATQGTPRGWMLLARRAALIESRHPTSPPSVAASARWMTAGAASDKVLSKVGVDYGSADSYFEKARLPSGSNTNKRAFAYFLLGGARMVYASAARIAVIRVVASMSASADVLALANLEVDLSNIDEGATVTVKWRGKPVFINHRSDAQIAEVSDLDVSALRDPQTDAERVQDPKW
jgi:hypothetical protein